MNITALNYTVKMLGRVFDTKNSTVPITETQSQKPQCKIIPVNNPFDRQTPEEQNIPSKTILAFLREVKSDSSLNMHNFFLMRNGKVLCEASFGAQDIRVPKVTFSECKSITSLAIGFLYDEKKLSLSEKIIDIFRDEVPAMNKLRIKDITIHNLLTMTSTVLFNEAESMTQTDWVKAFLNSSTRGDVGKTFNYNSLNTYMLSAIVCKKTGTTMSEYLEKKLFAPLGISDFFWEKCPKGIEKGGWGLYIRPEDMAKIGQMVLQKGQWNGKRIISEKYLSRALRPYGFPPKEFGDYDYGYQIWLSRSNSSFLFNGMFGQNVFGFPENGILIATNSGNGELFQQSSLYTYMNKYFSAPFSEKLEKNTAEYEKLQKYVSSLSEDYSARHSDFQGEIKKGDLPEECKTLDKKSFAASDERAVSAGLMPLLLQVLQNNYTKGVKNISFEIKDGDFYLNYAEADETHVLRIGFDEYKINDLSFHKEPYRVAVKGSFIYDDYLTLKIRMDFLENVSTRFLRFVFYPDKTVMYMSEKPGDEFLIDNFDSVKDFLVDRPIISTITKKMDSEYLFYRIEKSFSPKIKFSPVSQKKKKNND